LTEASGHFDTFFLVS